MSKTIHGHYGPELDAEVRRIKAYYDKLGVNISWREATDIAGMRSLDALWNDRKAREVLAKLRGVWA